MPFQPIVYQGASLAFAKIAQDRADGVVRGIGSMLFPQRARMGASAIEHRLPVISYIAEEVPDGLLMSYGQDSKRRSNNPSLKRPGNPVAPE